MDNNSINLEKIWCKGLDINNRKIKYDSIVEKLLKDNIYISYDSIEFDKIDIRLINRIKFQLDLCFKLIEIKKLNDNIKIDDDILYNVILAYYSINIDNIDNFSIEGIIYLTINILNFYNNNIDKSFILLQHIIDNMLVYINYNDIILKTDIINILVPIFIYNINFDKSEIFFAQNPNKWSN